MEQPDLDGQGWRVFPGHPRFARTMREYVRAAVANHHPDADPWIAAQLADELFVNAILHTKSGRPGGIVIGSYRHHQGGVRVAVHDQGAPDRPRPRARTRDAEAGRGLLLVDALAADWGVHPTRGGHTVWFDVGQPGTPGTGEPPADSRQEPATGQHPRNLARLLLTPN